MVSPTIATKKRLIFMLFMVMLVMVGLIIRLGYFQIIIGDELKKEALDQWSRDIPIEAKRGIIYDRNGKKLAISISADTVWCNPAQIIKEKEEQTAKQLAKILDMDEQKVLKLITKRQSATLIKRWITEEESNQLLNANLEGIEVVADNKRYYPYGNFAAQVIGSTNIDNMGQNGVELVYNKYLKGIPGRWVKTVDARQQALPNSDENIIEPQDGLNAVLTIDETIQHFAEKAALEALVKNKAKKVSIILMAPKTGEVLAMATKPDYDPNDRTKLLYSPTEPWRALSDSEINDWDKAPWQEKKDAVFSSWNNFPINATYEPGSTFKVITAASGLAQKVVTPDSSFYCDGYVRQVKSNKTIKCWRYYNPHGSQNFVEGAQNSCNEVFVEVGLRLGPEVFYEYIKNFGFGNKTGIDLNGEESGIVARPEYIKEVNLATISFGQGISVTPVQLVTAVSAVANGGQLMQPRVVKELVDNNGNVVKAFQPEAKKRVISEETSATLLKILESVVSEGTGGKAYIEGYKIGGKTGTAQKVIDGRYASGKYIASFVGIAPTDDPKVVALVIIDEPSNGIYYGGQIAAPVVGQVFSDTLAYLDIEPNYNQDSNASQRNQVVMVPDVRNKSLREASKELSKLGLRYSTETLEVQKNMIVRDQFPLPGTKVNEKSIIDLYIQTKREETETVIVPDLKGKSAIEVTNILNGLNLRFKFAGDGVVVNQEPNPGEIIDFNGRVEVKFNKSNLE